MRTLEELNYEKDKYLKRNKKWIDLVFEGRALNKLLESIPYDKSYEVEIRNRVVLAYENTLELIRQNEEEKEVAKQIIEENWVYGLLEEEKEFYLQHVENKE